MSVEDTFYELAAKLRARGVVTTHPTIAELRAYTHQQMLEGKIDGEVQDAIGRYLDLLELSFEARPGMHFDDHFAAAEVPWNVTRVLTDGMDDIWERAVDELFYPEGQDADERCGYEWRTPGGAGHATTEGLLAYGFTVVEVASRFGLVS